MEGSHDIIDNYAEDSASEVDNSDFDETYVPGSNEHDSDEIQEAQVRVQCNNRRTFSNNSDSDWSDSDNRKPSNFVFERNASVSKALDGNCSEFGCFSIYFSTNMTKKIKTETNRYAASQIAAMKRQGTLKTKSMWKRWQTIKLREMCKFFAIVLHMSLIKLAEIDDYWSADLFIATHFSKKLLSRDRFKGILYMLHINDNNNYIRRGQDGHDPIYKIRHFYDSFIRRCNGSFQPYAIYMDRFYTSPALLSFLWGKKTHDVGTVMKNGRELPSIFKTKKLKKGEVIFKRKQHILACKWKPTRDVYALSTQHTATTSLVDVRARGGIVEVEKPDLIVDYNLNKVGVDRADQLYSYYPFQRKTIEWWKKPFFHMFTMALINGYIIFKEKTNKKICVKQFIKAVALKLAEIGGVTSAATFK